MNKPVVRQATKEPDANMRVRSRNYTPPKVPRWVKVMMIVAIVLFASFLLLRLTLVPYLHSLGVHAG